MKSGQIANYLPPSCNYLTSTFLVTAAVSVIVYMWLASVVCVFVAICWCVCYLQGDAVCAGVCVCTLPDMYAEKL